MHLAALSVETDCCAGCQQVEQIAVLRMTQNVHLPPLCVQCLLPHVFFLFFFVFLLLSALCVKCAHTSLSASGRSIFLFSLFRMVLKHTHTQAGSLGTTGNYLQRMAPVRGVQIALWDGSAGQRDVNWRGFHFLRTPHLLFSVVNCVRGGGQRHRIYLYLSGRGCIFSVSCQRGWFAPLASPENTGCAQTARKWETWV